jgi:cytochrome c
MPSRSFVVVTLFLVPIASPAAGTDVPPALAKHDCLICHSVDEPKTGPAFVAIAQRYRGDARAPAKLHTVLAKGSHGGGPWQMPPAPQVAPADARSIVAWILALPAPAAPK